MQTYPFSRLHLRLLTGVALSITTLGLFFLPHWCFVGVIIALALYISVIEWPRLFSTQDTLFWLLPVYPLVPFGLILYLQLYGYDMLNLMMICIVGAHDSGSYFFGKHFGNHPIAPTISPNKTWEGFLGGSLLSFLFSLIFFGTNSLALIIGSILPLVLSLNFASLAGDLFESTLKRRTGIKDSGDLLPGHGGVLDRVDGLLFTAVVVFLARNYIRLLLAG